jgi:hypothetical protein
MIVSFCMLEAVDLLGSFVRALYVSSALGALRGNNRTITCARSFHSATEAFAYAAAWRFLRRFPGRAPPRYKREDEPAWHRLNNIRNLASDLSLSNEAAILLALARAGGSIDDLIALRNYFAHRNGESKTLAVGVLYRYAITPAESIEVSICQLVPTLSVYLIELLLTDLRDTIDLMAR